MSKCKSFAPAINENSKILILGSMPGIKSLEEAHYYAHPQNRFWKVMSVLCNNDMVSMDYQTRIQTLLDNNFALWDVIKSCKREGSLDSAIENEIVDSPKVKVVTSSAKAGTCNNTAELNIVIPAMTQVFLRLYNL